ncbi:MAG: hypothetical protein HOP16_10670 [Acidobacteria bacterium]|nr:hypothetical protein [Acidobacteriota bacterium]
MAGWKQVLLRAIACLVVSLAILAAIPVVFGSPSPIIRVAWRDIPPSERVELERRFQLTDPSELEDGTWGYAPPSASPNVLRALIGHEAVARVDGINASTAQLDRSLPLSPRRGGLIVAPWMARGSRLIAYLFALVGAVFLVMSTIRSPLLPAAASVALESIRSNPGTALRDLVTQLGAFLRRGVPLATPYSVAVFRVVFGSCVLWYVTAKPLDTRLIQSYEIETAGGLYGMVVRWMAEHPAIPANLDEWLIGSGGLFIAGALTPISYACFVGGVLLWACVLTLNTSSHAVASLSITMVCLLAARWSDAWSIDALARRIWKKPAPLVSAQRYGYAIWIPRLVLGITFLAAAWSKVGNGLAWVLNGTVKYYWVSDLDDALVTWGPRITESPAIAVFVSAVAVIVETVVITAAFSRSASYVSLLGIAALSLLAGFALFQGVFWWGWWILAMSFLPWQHMRWPAHRPVVAAHQEPLGLTWFQTAVAVTLLVQQCVMSSFHVEARPMLSAYDMYSATYANAYEFERATNLVYRVTILDGAERHPTDCQLADHDAALLPLAEAGDADARGRLRYLLNGCLPTDEFADAIALEGDRRVYDWQTRQFVWKRGLDVLGPAPVDWLRN